LKSLRLRDKYPQEDEEDYMTDSNPETNGQKPKSPHILVVDDEPGLRDMLRFGLQKRGYQVTAVPSGEEAIIKVAAENYDAVICDIMMPGIGGVDTLRRIKEKSPETAVIMATGFATLEIAIESMKSGAFDFVTKPYGVPQLCSILEKAVQWRQMRARIDHLEELHRLKDEFLSTISHELLTPLTIILGYAGLMQQHRNYSPDEMVNGLVTIESKAKGLLRMVTNIIDYANASGTGQHLYLESCSLTKLGEEIVTSYRPLAEAKSITLSCQASEDFLLETDKAKVKQILVNLVDNAIKFTKAGHVAIRMEAADEGHVKIQVEDSGCGVDPGKMYVIFQDFRQADQSHVREYGGAGLGLAVAHRFVELLGGQINLTSSSEKGSTFTVILPGRKTRLADPALTAPQPNKLLIVDDDPAMTRIFASLFSREGYIVSTAAGGREALSQMKRQKPDALLLDLVMPDVDGFDVLASIAAISALKDVRIIIITSRELKPEERARLEQRAELIIQKGTKDLPEILNLINQSLKRHPPELRIAS
jgi:signal transduction histidine kinase